MKKISKAFGKGSLHGYNILSLRMLGLKSSSRVNTKRFFNDFIFSFLFMLKLGFAQIIYERKSYFVFVDRTHELERVRFLCAKLVSFL